MPEPDGEQLDLLLALQATDHRVRRLEHQLDDLPEQRQLEETEQRVAELGGQQDDVRLELERAAASQRRLEREIDVLAERRDAERARLYEGNITNQREMQSLEAEIAAVERRISEHEDDELEVLETIEELEGRRDALSAERDQLQRRAEELTVARDESAKDLLAELGELRVRRDEQAAGLPEDLLARYERIAARTGGTGVGVLEGNACTACRIDLSMADVNDLLTGPPLAECPQCRRLLVVPA